MPANREEGAQRAQALAWIAARGEPQQASHGKTPFYAHSVMAETRRELAIGKFVRGAKPTKKTTARKGMFRR